MFWNEAFIYTLREDPAEAELVSHKLMIRAGMISKLSSGIYNYLPLGLRVIKRIENIIREEMSKCGAAELLMPAVIPSELWKESGRWNFYGSELLRIKDRKDNEYCIGPTHEEVITDVVRDSVRSYRDLPVTLYQIQSKFRDEVRPRYGLMRSREFIMKDAYSFHTDSKSLDRMYWRMHQAYTDIFERCGLTFRAVEADSGNIGGDISHEYHVLADSGEDTIIYCDSCDYAANIERAKRSRPAEPLSVSETSPETEKVTTPGKKTIEEVSSFLGISTSECVKMLIYEIDNSGKYVAVNIRGDIEVNETKLRSLLNAETVSVPDEKMLRDKYKIPVGFLGAIDCKFEIIDEIIGDYSVEEMSDCVCGGNETDIHVKHVFPSRDLKIDRYADIGFAREGDCCPDCKEGAVKTRKGIEIGQIFKLGKKYSKAMNLKYLDKKGVSEFVTMGCYGIGVGRLAAAAIEQNHDGKGIIWPLSIAPYDAEIVCLDMGDDEVRRTAEKIYTELRQSNYDILFDNRNERPGVKFNDADLIGLPFRVTVGKRGLKEGTIEIKARSEKEVIKIKPESVREFFRKELKVKSGSN